MSYNPGNVALNEIRRVGCTIVVVIVVVLSLLVGYTTVRHARTEAERQYSESATASILLRPLDRNAWSEKLEKLQKPELALKMLGDGYIIVSAKHPVYVTAPNGQQAQVIWLIDPDRKPKIIGWCDFHRPH